MDISTATPLWQLTVGEYLELVDNIYKKHNSNKKDKPESIDSDLCHGLEGIAKLLGCSNRHASRVKKSGKIDRAITQDGRTIIVKKSVLLECLAEVDSKKKFKKQ
jgi:hypothetical protein